VVGKFYRSTTQSPRFQHNSDLQAAILTAQCSPEWIWTAPFGRCGGAGGVCRRPSAKTWSLRPPAGSMEEVIGQIACRLPELAEAIDVKRCEVEFSPGRTAKRPFQCWPSTAPEATWAEDFPANEEWAYCLGIALVVLGIPQHGSYANNVTHIAGKQSSSLLLESCRRGGSGDRAEAPGPGARRSLTPRGGAGPPLRLLRICLNERVLGGVEVNEASTLADVRQSIQEDEIPGVPSSAWAKSRAIRAAVWGRLDGTSYAFLFGGAPVTLRQESRRRAVECFPFLSLIPEDAPVPLAGSLSSLPSLQGAPLEVETSSRVEEADSGHRLELQITDGPLEGTFLTVGEEGARVGRHTSNTLVIPEAGISRFHCEITFMDGEFNLKDLGSTTGTFFYLRPHGHFQIFPGLMVKLGETEMQVLAQSSAEPSLTVLFTEGPLAGHKVTIPPGGITIGRVADNSLVLVQDGTVSAHHAMIFLEQGSFYITDLGSCNGTCLRLSGERQESSWHPIMDGDVVGAGCTKIRCKLRTPESR
ncbi:unnamed protein product, partial [Durusdinium trenchii]